MSDEKYPNIKVKLSEEDGNVFAIIGRTVHALQRGGVSKEEINKFKEEATAGDYDHAIQTVMKWVDWE